MRGWARWKDMMFSGQSVSAADREAWRRWAKAGSTQRRRKRKKKKKLPKTSLRHAAPVPAILRRVRGGASVPVHRQSGGYFSRFTETGAHRAKTVQKTGDSPGVFLGSVGTRPSLCNEGSAVAVGAVLDAPVVGYDRYLVVQTVLQVEVPQFQFFRQVPRGSDSAENCLKGQL